jgi:DNA-directed RNA polymerase specialized sigma24 family protein
VIPHLKQAQIDKIVALYGSGKTGSEVAAMCGVSRNTVYRHLRTHHAVRGHGLTESQVDDLVARYHAGETETELGVVFGVDQGTVSRWLSRREPPI